MSWQLRAWLGLGQHPRPHYYVGLRNYQYHNEEYDRYLILELFRNGPQKCPLRVPK